MTSPRRAWARVVAGAARAPAMKTAAELLALSLAAATSAPPAPAGAAVGGFWDESGESQRTQARGGHEPKAHGP